MSAIEDWIRRFNAKTLSGQSQVTELACPNCGFAVNLSGPMKISEVALRIECKCGVTNRIQDFVNLTAMVDQ